MRQALFLATLLTTSCLTQDHDWIQTVEAPVRMVEVICAVAAMPECGEVRGGGAIRWRAGEFVCGPGDRPGCGCSWPREAPPRVEVAFQEDAATSWLAHELCHVCGYEDQVEAEACAFRALQTMAGCPESLVAWDWTVDLPTGVAEVIAAVADLSECSGVRSGGIINWHAGDFLCVPNSAPAMGCAWPNAKPVVVEVAYRARAKDSALAHELCHVCGYTDEATTQACAIRALQALP